MKSTMIILLTLLLYPLVYGQPIEGVRDTIMIDGLEYYTNGSDTILIIDPMPEFPGGKEGLMQYLMENLDYRYSVERDNIQGVVVVAFVVDSTGQTRDVKVEKGVRRDLDRVAVRLIKKMPPWKPGEQHGKKVNTPMTLPIYFNFDKTEHDLSEPSD